MITNIAMDRLLDFYHVCLSCIQYWRLQSISCLCPERCNNFLHHSDRGLLIIKPHLTNQKTSAATPTIATSFLMHYFSFLHYKFLIHKLCISQSVTSFTAFVLHKIENHSSYSHNIAQLFHC